MLIFNVINISKEWYNATKVNKHKQKFNWQAWNYVFIAIDSTKKLMGLNKQIWTIELLK